MTEEVNEVNVHPAAASGEGAAHSANDQQQVAPPPIMETAFVVYLNPQGQWVVTDEVHACATMQVARTPGITDFKSAFYILLGEIQSQETAALSARMQGQMMEQMAAKLKQDQINQQIQQITNAPAGGIDLSSLKR